MPHRDTCELTFFEWLDTLSDEEHTRVFEALLAVAHDLDVVIEQKPQLAHQLLDLIPHNSSMPFLN
jgi:hypothetical protein